MDLLCVSFLKNSKHRLAWIKVEQSGGWTGSPQWIPVPQHWPKQTQALPQFIWRSPCQSFYCYSVECLSLCMLSAIICLYRSSWLCIQFPLPGWPTGASKATRVRRLSQASTILLAALQSNWIVFNAVHINFWKDVHCQTKQRYCDTKPKQPISRNGSPRCIKVSSFLESQYIVHLYRRRSTLFSFFI